MENIESKLIDVVVSYLRGEEEDNITSERINNVLNRVAGMFEGLADHVSENDKDEAYEQLLKTYNLYVEPSVGSFKTKGGYKVTVTAVKDGRDATLPFLNHLACVLIDAKYHAVHNNLQAVAENYRDDFLAICKATEELEGKK